MEIPGRRYLSNEKRIKMISQMKKKFKSYRRRPPACVTGEALPNLAQGKRVSFRIVRLS